MIKIALFIGLINIISCPFFHAMQKEVITSKSTTNNTSNLTKKEIALLKETSNITIKNNLLLKTAGKGDTEAVELILNCGADINAQGSNHETALIIASHFGYITLVELLLNKGADVTKQDALLGNTALLDAAERGYNKIVNLLLNAGADIDAKNTALENTALINAAWKGHTQVVKTLLDKKATIDAKNKNGDTAFMWAALNNYTDIMSLLLERGANINAKNEFGQTALMWAADHNNSELITFLLKNGADIDAKNNEGKTALDHAINSKEARRLLEICALPEIREYLKDTIAYSKKSRGPIIGRGKQWITPTWLMIACIFGHIEFICSFKHDSLEYINAKDSYGCTAFDYALQCNPNSVATLINMFGTKINQLSSQPTSFVTTLISYIPYLRTNKKEEFLNLAIERGHLPLVNALLSIGAQPTIELAQKARENGYLKIMNRLVFSALASLPQNKKCPYITSLSHLFK